MKVWFYPGKGGHLFMSRRSLMTYDNLDLAILAEMESSWGDGANTDGPVPKTVA
jgi:hypothetical protein